MFQSSKVFADTLWIFATPQVG